MFVNNARMRMNKKRHGIIYMNAFRIVGEDRFLDCTGCCTSSLWLAQTSPLGCAVLDQLTIVTEI